jgi:hypothetical protein
MRGLPFILYSSISIRSNSNNESGWGARSEQSWWKTRCAFAGVQVAMIIFPFGFYILDGKAPVYVGNDLQAQNTVRAWKEANPERVQLGFDEVGSVQVSTIFEGWDHGSSPSRMDSAPRLFETRVLSNQKDLHKRRYSDYDAAMAGHAELVKCAGKWQ